MTPTEVVMVYRSYLRNELNTTKYSLVQGIGISSSDNKSLFKNLNSLNLC